MFCFLFFFFRYFFLLLYSSFFHLNLNIKCGYIEGVVGWFDFRVSVVILGMKGN